MSAPLRERWHTLRQRPAALWGALALIHVVMFAALLPAMLQGSFGGDLGVYSNWATEAWVGGIWPIFHYDWVYPPGALLPVMLPRVLGLALYEALWLVLIALANAAALWGLIRAGHKVRDQSAAGWWVLTVGILAPVDLLRLEGFTAPAVVLGLLFLRSRPRAAGLLLALATWVKVWPAAVVVAVVVASTKRWTVMLMGVIVSAVISLVVVIGGGVSHLGSFVNAQNGRPLQIEAPLATPWLWMAALRVPGARVFHDSGLVTEEVTGPGDRWIVDHGTFVMLLVMAALVVILAVATYRLNSLVHPIGKEIDLVLVGALGLASAFIVFNKVGSPQYMLWLTPIVAVGLVLRPPDWKVPAILLVAISALTTIVFPSFYFMLLDLEPALVGVLGLRNLLVVFVLGWSVAKLAHAAFATQTIPLGTRPLGTTVRSTSY